jgi:phage tail sheath protein FI
MYILDPVSYDEDGVRLFDSSTAKPDVRKTKEQFNGRAIDNSYVATYFPDVFIDDPVNKRRVKVPSSIPALGALAFNDKSSYPWYAPAGFNRASLDFVTNVEVRLNKADRDSLHDARINPIATFPRQGYVVWGQKTLQQAQSALDRVNVRRLMLEIKKQVIDIAQRFVFEQNTASTRQRFIKLVKPPLGLIQTQSGIERFDIVMDESNNTSEDIESNRLNGRIIVTPTRTFEFVAVDFIITNSGVSFN